MASLGGSDSDVTTRYPPTQTRRARAMIRNECACICARSTHHREGTFCCNKSLVSILSSWCIWYDQPTTHNDDTTTMHKTSDGVMMVLITCPILSVIYVFDEANLSLCLFDSHDSPSSTHFVGSKASRERSSTCVEGARAAEATHDGLTGHTSPRILVLSCVGP